EVDRPLESEAQSNQEAKPEGMPAAARPNAAWRTPLRSIGWPVKSEPSSPLRNSPSAPLTVVCYSTRLGWSGWPVPTAWRRAWMAGGGGAVDHARHQRERNVHGSSQARTRRRVTGQVTTMHALAVAESVPMPPLLL